MTCCGCLALGLGEAGAGEVLVVNNDEEALGAGEDCAVGVVDLGLVEELAALAAEVAAGEHEQLVERGGAKVIDLHVAGHGEDAEGTVELAHGLVEQGGDDASMNVAGRAFVKLRELDVSGGGGDAGVRCVDGEVEVESLRVGRAAAEAVVGALIEGGSGLHRRLF